MRCEPKIWLFHSGQPRQRSSCNSPIIRKEPTWSWKLRSYWIWSSETGTYIIDITVKFKGRSGNRLCFSVIIPPVQQSQIHGFNNPDPNRAAIKWRINSIRPGETTAVVSGRVPRCKRAAQVLSLCNRNQNFIVMFSFRSRYTGLRFLIFQKYLLPATTGILFETGCFRKPDIYQLILADRTGNRFYLTVIIPARVKIPENSYRIPIAGQSAACVVSYSAYAYEGQIKYQVNSGPTPNAFLRISGMGTGMINQDIILTNRW